MGCSWSSCARSEWRSRCTRCKMGMGRSRLVLRSCLALVLGRCRLGLDPTNRMDLELGSCRLVLGPTSRMVRRKMMGLGLNPTSQMALGRMMGSLRRTMVLTRCCWRLVRRCSSWRAMTRMLFKLLVVIVSSIFVVHRTVRVGRLASTLDAA